MCGGARKEALLGKPEPGKGGRESLGGIHVGASPGDPVLGDGVAGLVHQDLERCRLAHGEAPAFGKVHHSAHVGRNVHNTNRHRGGG